MPADEAVLDGLNEAGLHFLAMCDYCGKTEDKIECHDCCSNWLHRKPKIIPHVKVGGYYHNHVCGSCYAEHCSD